MLGCVEAESAAVCGSTALWVAACGLLTLASCASDALDPGAFACGAGGPCDAPADDSDGGRERDASATTDSAGADIGATNGSADLGTANDGGYHADSGGTDARAASDGGERRDAGSAEAGTESDGGTEDTGAADTGATSDSGERRDASLLDSGAAAIVDARPGDTGQPSPSCTDDRYEENDSVTGALLIAGGVHTNLTACPADEDWYAVAVVAGRNVMVTARFRDSEGDIDLVMYDVSGTQVARAQSFTDDEIMSFIPQTNGYFTLRVYMYGDDGAVPGNSYELDIVN